MKKVNGSLTVEAALILPMMFLVIGLAMDGGLQLYRECCKTVAAVSEEEDFEVVQLFYHWKAVEDLVKDGN